jgi:hypothetical protein
MSKIANLQAANYLKPFRDEMGNLYAKCVNDCDTFVGRLEKDVLSKSSGWQVGTKGRLVSKEGHTLQLPPNSGYSSLIQFGLQIQRIADNGSIDEPVYKMDIQSNMPFACKQWFDNQYRTKAVATEKVAA